MRHASRLTQRSRLSMLFHGAFRAIFERFSGFPRIKLSQESIRRLAGDWLFFGCRLAPGTWVGGATPPSRIPASLRDARSGSCLPIAGTFPGPASNLDSRQRRADNLRPAGPKAVPGNGDIAQMVTRRTHYPKIDGSSEPGAAGRQAPAGRPKADGRNGPSPFHPSVEATIMGRRISVM